MKSVIEFIVGAFILILFAAAFVIALFGADAPHASTQTDAHRAWVADYAAHTQDEAALEYLRGE